MRVAEIDCDVFSESSIDVISVEIIDRSLIGKLDFIKLARVFKFDSKDIRDDSTWLC